MLVLIQHIRVISRREFLVGSARLAALSVLGWPQSGTAQPSDGRNASQLAHLAPLASHERILIKASFKAPLTGTPLPTVNEGRRGVCRWIRKYASSDSMCPRCHRQRVDESMALGLSCCESD